MSATLPPHEFDGYTLRPATEADLELAKRWTEADADHAERVHPPFWLEQGAGVDSYVLCRDGEPMFFLRMERTVRLHIQFGPAGNAEERARTRTALEKGMRWLGMALGAGATREIVFSSTSKLLRRFCTGKLQFEAAADTLVRTVMRLPQRQ